MKKARFLLFIIAATLLSGCHFHKQDQVKNFFEWTDSYGRSISLKSEPQRIVSISPAITELLYLIGAEEKIAGVSDYCNYPEAATKLPKIGGMQNINMEALVALQPDVVLISSMVSKKDVETIEKMNIPVISIIEENNIEGMADVITTLGKICNREEAANKEATAWKTCVEQVKSNDTSNTGKRVYYVVGFGDTGDFTAPKGSHIHQIIELAGCKNIGEKLTGWNVSREYLFQEDPDIILVRAEDKETFCSQSPYNKLTAVKEGRVYPINSGWIDIVSPRNIKAIELIRKKAAEQ